MRIFQPNDPLKGRRRDAADAGFTLVEVVLAMSIIALLVALGLPFARNQAGIAALDSKAFEIATLLRSERNAALQSGKTNVVIVDVNRGVIRAAGALQVTLPSFMSLHIEPDGLRNVQFLPDGRASGVRLSIASGSRRVTIGVNSITAAIDMSGERL